MSFDVNALSGSGSAQPALQAAASSSNNIPDFNAVDTSMIAAQAKTDPMAALAQLFALMVQTLRSILAMILAPAGESSGTQPSSAAGDSGAPAQSGTGAGAASGSSASTVAASGEDSPGGAGETTAAPESSAGCCALSTPKNTLQAVKDDAGVITVLSDDGYTVTCEGRSQAWRITGPDGKTTRVWGDPHVNESDGAAWDFSERSSFAFGKNKLTVEVVPAGNGQYLTSKIHVYNESERISIGGIDSNKPEITADANDAPVHDAGLADGRVLRRQITAQGEAWVDAATKREMAAAG